MGKHVRNGIDYTDPNIDGALSNTSTRPVQNKVITEALNNKANISDLAWMDTNGDIYFGDKRIIRVMDEDSYKDLVDSGEEENILYYTYPTPTDGRSLSVNPQNSEIENNTGDEPEEENELDEPVEEQPENPLENDMR